MEDEPMVCSSCVPLTSCAALESGACAALEPVACAALEPVACAALESFCSTSCSLVMAVPILIHPSFLVFSNSTDQSAPSRIDPTASLHRGDRRAPRESVSFSGFLP